MTKRKYLYVCFVNWCEGEIHLRRCDVVQENSKEVEVEIIYDGDYDEKEITHVRLGKDAIAKGQYASSEKAFFYRCHEEMKDHEWGPTWNTLYATPGDTREDALKHQRSRMEWKITQAKERIEMCERLIEELDGALTKSAPINVYDTAWNSVKESPLIQLARCAEED